MLTAKQESLKVKHGTPEEFNRALLKAAMQFTITPAEGTAAVTKYKEEWRQAGIVTAAEIEAAKTPQGGWTRKSLVDWGVPWPPPQGWKERLIENGGCGACHDACGGGPCFVKEHSPPAGH